MPGDATTPVKLRLSSLWVSVMLCYIYGGIFSFFKPGTLKDILAGGTGAFGSPGRLLAAAILMAIPSVMVFLSLALKPGISRYANIVLGLAYTVVIASTTPGAWAFYVLLGVVEAMLTLTIAWYAWRWQASCRSRLRTSIARPATGSGASFPQPDDLLRRAALAQPREGVRDAVLVRLAARVGHGVDRERDVEPQVVGLARARFDP